MMMVVVVVVVVEGWGRDQKVKSINSDMFGF
jgi:hypothetical protein